MATITAGVRDALITIYIGMFKSAPGRIALSDMVAKYESGMTQKEIAAELSSDTGFTTEYPEQQLPGEFADELVTWLANEATASGKAWATNWITSQLQAGKSKAHIIVEAVNALRAATNVADFGNAKASLNNKLDVARYYAVTKENPNPNANVIADVTSSAATVTEAKGEIDGIQVVGQTYTLTPGADVITGTAGNDTFNALSINSAGAGANTFTNFDNINGGAGTDTLNIYHDNTGPFNATFGANTTVSNVEIINIYNTGAAGAFGDASKFQGATQLWQHGFAAAVTNLGAGTAAGFKGLPTASAMSVTAAAGVAGATIALDTEEGSTLAVAGAALNSVTIVGTVNDGPDAGTAVTSLATTITAGLNATSLTVNSAVAATLTLADNAATGATQIATVDASGSTGAITFAGSITDTSAATTYAARTIKTGSGNDVVTTTVATVVDNVATAADETVSALVETGAGNDTITVSTTGTGLTTINSGAGNDTINVTSRGTKLVVNMGDGSDTFTSAVAITANDVIDAGAGVDTLRLSLVGAANVVAFKNFEVYDVVGMNANLDLDILNANNTVAEIVGSGALGGATTLQNVGAGVNFRATANMGATALTIAQKTAGALTVTVDADRTVDVAGDDTTTTTVISNTATSLNAVFDTNYVGAPGAGTAGGETAATDNVSTINLTTNSATTVNVTSGGTNAQNVINVNDTLAAGKVATIVATGAQALTLTHTAVASALNSVDSSALTGGLTFSLANLKNGGSVTLGSGTDVITATNTSTNVGGTANIESIVGFEKTAAVSLSTAVADTVAKNAAIAGADKIVIAGGSAATDVTVGLDAVANGKITFGGAGPATLDAAIAIADALAETAGEVAVFEYLGNSYVFAQGGGTDTVVKLVGITGVTNIVENGATDQFFIV